MISTRTTSVCFPGGVIPVMPIDEAKSKLRFCLLCVTFHPRGFRERGDSTDRRKLFEMSRTIVAYGAIGAIKVCGTFYLRSKTINQQDKESKKQSGKTSMFMEHAYRLLARVTMYSACRSTRCCKSLGSNGQRGQLICCSIKKTFRL